MSYDDTIAELVHALILVGLAALYLRVRLTERDLRDVLAELAELRRLVERGGPAGRAGGG